MKLIRIALPAILWVGAIFLATCGGPADTRHPEWRGLLASPGFEGTAVKGVYFFPGEGRHANNYTTHPLDPADEKWNSSPDPSTRVLVMDRMVRAHVSTVVMSYWSDMPQWSPMDVASKTRRNVVCKKKPDVEFFLESDEPVIGVLAAAKGRHLVILPVVEQGNDKDCPEVPHWEFSEEFPFLPFELPDNPELRVAPGLVARVGKLVEVFRGRMDQWAQIYDRDGVPRYAVQIIHVSSNVIDQLVGTDRDDKQFAKGFDDVAARVKSLYHIDVGFTIDTTGLNTRYSAFPHEAGRALEKTPSVLAIQGFVSEIFSGLINNGPDPCVKIERGLCEPQDNNRDNLERLADWKRDALNAWLETGVPIILDITSGYDARIVFGRFPDGTPGRTAFWGDNFNYTEDRWRNWMSELKEPRIKGIVVDTWNGYTEGYAAVPSLEHGHTVYNWLTDLLEPAPWDCSHMHYVNGAPTHRVYGAVCEKWKQLGADRAFGPPVSEELPSGRGRKQYFLDQKAIYWSGGTGAHAVYGIIGKTYQETGASESCLGFPVADEEPNNDGRILRFEHGTITWRPGDARGSIHCS